MEGLCCSELESYFWNGVELLLVATFPASLAGHFEEARKSMCHAFTVFSHVGEQDHNKLVSILVSCARNKLIPKPNPTIHREGHVALDPLLWRFFDVAQRPLDETIRLRMVRRVSTVQPFEVFARFYERV